MANSLILRVATIEDQTPVGELLWASYTALMPSGYDDKILTAALPMITQANPALLSSGKYYLSHSNNGTMVGCGGWTNERPGTGEILSELAHLRHFATHPDWNGRGIGRMIYERCRQTARSVGVSRFECYSSVNAIGFYSALGFKEVSQVEVSIGPCVKFPSVLMEVSI